MRLHPGQSCNAVFLGKTTHFRGAFLHPRVKVGSNELNNEGRGGGDSAGDITLRWTSIPSGASHPGERERVEIILVKSDKFPWYSPLWPDTNFTLFTLRTEQ